MINSTHYTTGCDINSKFSAYDDTFEPKCLIGSEHPSYRTVDVHSYHDLGNKVANTTNDLLLGIWTILQRQATWLTGKIGSLDPYALNQAVSQIRRVNLLSQEDLNKQSTTVIDAVKLAISESQRGSALSQQGLDKLAKDVKDVRDIVMQTSKEVRDQNREMLVKLNGLEEEIERVIKNSSAKTDTEKLVLENNRILKRFEDENLGYTQKEIADLIKSIKTPGLEQLVRREDLNELEKKIDPKTLVRRVDLKQDTILEKLEEQQRTLVNFDAKGKEIFKEISSKIDEISEKIDRASMDALITEELEQAKEHLNKVSQRITTA